MLPAVTMRTEQMVDLIPALILAYRGAREAIVGISVLSLIAAFLYLFVIAACLMAARSAIKHEQQKWHVAVWLVLVALFAGLIAMRFMGLEDVVRDWVREILRERGLYEVRRDFQRPLAAAVFVVFAFVASYAVWRFHGYWRGRRNMAAALGAAGAIGMVFLLCLRFVSLHDLDRILYGPLKLNWIGDIGITFLVFGAAIFYRSMLQACDQLGRNGMLS